MSTDQQQASVTVTTPSGLEVRIERVFDAPRELVFATMTDPKLIPEWWGPTTSVDVMDVRVGGSWRFVTASDWGEAVFRGEYREVDPPQRLVQTFELEAMPGKVHLQTLTFEALGERTRLTTVLRFDSVEERDGLLASGAQQGMGETYARVDALLARLAAG